MRTVILIEDKDSHSDILTMTLSNLGFEVIPCSTFADVQNVVAALQAAAPGTLLDLRKPPGAHPLHPAEPPSGVILDLRIPEVGVPASLECGRDCGLWLRSQPLTRDVPIIAYSAFGEDERIPGWCDMIRTVAFYDKNEDESKELDDSIKKHFL